jgi:hypothetical protein
VYEVLHIWQWKHLSALNVSQGHPVPKHMQEWMIEKLQMEPFPFSQLCGIQKLLFWKYLHVKVMLHTAGMLLG